MRRAWDRLRSVRFSPPQPAFRALAEVQVETGVDFHHARARAGFGRGHLLEVRLQLPGGVGSATENDAAEALLSRLLGEEIFERWVGQVSATPSARGGPLRVLNSAAEPSAFALETLPETVLAAIAGLKQGLPSLPLAASDAADWVAFELEPAESAADYAAQDDLLFCSTRLPELKKSYLRAEPFFSGRFTNSDALFAYLKYETPRASPAERVARRSALEALIEGVLTPAEGSVVGLGLGLRYCYIDLALTDPGAVEERLLPALCGADIPERAWLMFCDTELEHEYVPVRAQAPSPYLG